MGKLAQLRELLGVENDRRELERLDDRLSDHRHNQLDIAEVLPDAIRTADSRGTLSSSLAQPVEQAIHESIGRNPKVFADVLFPVMGPAIRRSITETLKSFVEGLNQAMEQRMSPSAIAWRFEAWKTGLSYREVILRHTVEYRVRLAFLIHRPSGLLIYHAGERQQGDVDEDAFSAMLTAIQDFIRDSTDQGDEDTSLSSAELADQTVWIFSGYAARLAVVIDGHPPLSLRDILNQKLEQAHNLDGLWLKRFDGSQQCPEDVREQVDACILTKEKERESSKAQPGLWVVLAVIVGIAGWIGYRLYQSYHTEKLLEQVDTAFATEPGVILIRRAREGQRWIFEGLADPLARRPEAIVDPIGLPPEQDFRFSAYYAADSAIEAKRLSHALPPPPGATITEQGDRILISGQAPPEWIRRLNELIAHHPDPGRFDSLDLTQDHRGFLKRVLDAVTPTPTLELSLDGSRLVMAGSGPKRLIAEVENLVSTQSDVILDHDDYQDEIWWP